MMARFLLTTWLLSAALLSAAQPATLQQTTLQMYGPVQFNGSDECTPSTSFGLCFSAFTSETKWIGWSYGLPPVLKAWWTVVWTPESPVLKTRLLSFYPQYTPVCTLNANYTGGPVPQGCDITTFVQNLQQTKSNASYFVAMFQGDGAAKFRLYEMRLEILFQLP